LTYQLTIFGVDDGGNIMPPVVLNGVSIYEVDEQIGYACGIHGINQIDTVLMAKEGEHGEA